ncbi:MAG: DUF1761 domain-containing protein [Dongiaceae bacterium]
MTARINWLAVLLAIVAQMAIGFLWYGFLFQAQWMAAVGIPPEAAGAPGSMTAPMIVSVLSALAIAILLSLIVNRGAVGGFGEGVKWGFLLWLLLALPMHAIPNIWAGRDTTLTVIDGSEALAALVVAGAIIGLIGPRRR